MVASDLQEGVLLSAPFWLRHGEHVGYMDPSCNTGIQLENLLGPDGLWNQTASV